jgi:hypothetical protein
MMPSRSLHRLAARLCTPMAVERIVEPAIADLQKEYANAATGRTNVRRAQMLLAGYAAVLEVIVMCALDTPILRTLLWAAAMTAGAASLLLILTLAVVPGISPYYVSLLAALLLPIAIPAGITLGIVVALSGKVVSRRTGKGMIATAVIAAAISFSMTLLSPPVASQSFRQSVSNALGGRGVVKAANDLSAFAIQQQPAFAPGGDLKAWPLRRAWTKHLVLSVPFATPVLVVFALAVVRRGAPGTVVIAGCAVYCLLVLVGEPLVHQGLPPFAAAWLANASTVVAAVILMNWPTGVLGRPA